MSAIDIRPRRGAGSKPAPPAAGLEARRNGVPTRPGPSSVSPAIPMTQGMSRSRLAAEDGFTLVELMMAALVLVVGVLGVLSLLDHANRATERTKHREAATNLAREVIEASRAV